MWEQCRGPVIWCLWKLVLADLSNVSRWMVRTALDQDPFSRFVFWGACLTSCSLIVSWGVRAGGGWQNNYGTGLKIFKPIVKLTVELIQVFGELTVIQEKGSCSHFELRESVVQMYVNNAHSQLLHDWPVMTLYGLNPVSFFVPWYW